jgi:hypothetical protein
LPLLSYASSFIISFSFIQHSLFLLAALLTLYSCFLPFGTALTLPAFDVDVAITLGDAAY